MQLWWVQQPTPAPRGEAGDRAVRHPGQQHSGAGGRAGGGRPVSDLSIKVAKRRRKPITFDLEGSDHQYTYTPQKQANMVLPMLESEDDLEAAKAGFDWLGRGLSKEDMDHLVARLKDEEDDLDFDVLEDLIEGLVEKTGGNPTT